MLQKKLTILRTAVMGVGLIFIGIALDLSFANFAITHDEYDEYNYLPVILNEDIQSPTPTQTGTPNWLTATPTPTPTATATTDFCGLFFEEPVIAENNYVRITGFTRQIYDPLYEEYIVTIIDMNFGITLGTGILRYYDGHICNGFTQINFSPGTLVAGHLLLAESNNLHAPTTTFVLEGTPIPQP